MRTSAGANSPIRQFIPPLLELARDKGWIGQALSAQPDWLIREADRWAKWQAEYAKEKHQPNRLPLPDPWQFLLGIHDPPPEFTKICRAAQSQLLALRDLCRRGTGVATSETDWQAEALIARARGKKRSLEHAADKVTIPLYQTEPAQAMIQGFCADDPARLENMVEWRKHRRSQLVHRGGGNRADAVNPLLGWQEIKAQFPIETLITVRWVRIRPDGPPGFMFWRNEALTKLALALQRMPRLRFRNFGRDYIKNLRQNLRLIPVADKSCMVWEVAVSTCDDGGWLVKGFERNGALVFHELFPKWEVL